MNRRTRDVVLEAWPRWVDPASEGARTYEDWPVTFNQEEGDGRKVVSYLATVEYVEGLAPALEVTDVTLNEHVYSMRPNGTSYQVPVYDEGHDYQLKVSHPDGTVQTYSYRNGTYPSTDVIRSVEDK